MTISNSIIWEEQADPFEIFHNNQSQLNLYDYYINNCLIISEEACNLPGGQTACGSGNIFGQYPRFLDTLNRNFGIAACSPAIDAGNNALPILFNMTTDYTGAPRIQQSTVDIGAYERPASWQTALAEAVNVTCPEGNDGAVYFTSTGDEPLAYSWQNDSLSGSDNTGLAPGAYAFTITDAAGCADTVAVQITAPSPIDIQYTIVNASNAQSTDGSIAINTATGGTPPYTLLWSTGDTSLFISQLPAGSYSLTLIDANGCEAFYDFIVGAITSRRELNQAGSFTLLPNPAAAGAPAFLKYDVSNPAWEGRLRLYHSSGQLLRESDWQAAGRQGLTPIPTTQLPAGLYWLVLDIPGFSPLSWKWIVE
ncbi:MAG: SprB repeat-containing protein [Saprospiraceae bacterium]|nr:SprB repeat-containing protein [Saprospiraceae bacterium]